MTVRNAARDEVSRKYTPPEWFEGKVCPRIITGSIMDCFKSFVSSEKLKKSGHITHYTIHNLSKKDKSQSMFLEKSMFSKTSNQIFMKQYFGTDPLKGYYKRGRKSVSLDCLPLINGTDGHDCRIVFDAISGRYFLCLTKTDVCVSDKQTDFNHVISLDSGIHTFQTGYSPSHHVLNIGTCTKDRLLKLLCKQDILRSLVSKTKTLRRKRNYWKGFYKVSRKLRSLVNELHWKTINHLTTNYKLIVLGEFNVSSLMKNKKLSRVNKRLLACQSHYKFKERLQFKCMTRNVTLQTQDESYTSMTCCRCGWLHKTLGTSRTFECKICNLIIDRDFNGAVNIFIKYMMGTSLGCLKDTGISR
jgi:transposase